MRRLASAVSLPWQDFPRTISHVLSENRLECRRTDICYSGAWNTLMTSGTIFPGQSGFDGHIMVSGECSP